MADITQHLSEREFSCRCGCGLCRPTRRMKILFEKVRSVLGVPMIVTSGQRCLTHNKRVNGASDSQHLIGNAVDFFCREADAEYVYNKILKAYGKGELPELGAIGFSATKHFVHIDARSSDKLTIIKYK